MQCGGLARGWRDRERGHALSSAQRRRCRVSVCMIPAAPATRQAPAPPRARALAGPTNGNANGVMFEFESRECQCFCPMFYLRIYRPQCHHSPSHSRLSRTDHARARRPIERPRRHRRVVPTRSEGMLIWLGLGFVRWIVNDVPAHSEGVLSMSRRAHLLEAGVGGRLAKGSGSSSILKLPHPHCYTPTSATGSGVPPPLRLLLLCSPSNAMALMHAWSLG